MKKTSVVILDYQLGNVFSIVQACQFWGINAKLSNQKSDLMAADAVILPGVGAFGDAMSNLHRLDLVSPLRDKIAAGTPLMGICLGLQLLFTESEEFGNHKGLGFIDGSVRRFQPSAQYPSMRVPHIGWNKILRPSERTQWHNSPLAQQHDNFMYFIHSYHAQPQQTKDILAVTQYYDSTFCSAIKKGNIFATQFHPEKSGQAGIEIFRQWFLQIQNPLPLNIPLQAASV